MKTLKVRFLQSVAGVRTITEKGVPTVVRRIEHGETGITRELRDVQRTYGWAYSEGEEVDMPEKDARVWADGVRAEPVGWERGDEPETTSEKPAEATESQRSAVETTMSAGGAENASRRTSRPNGR